MTDEPKTGEPNTAGQQQQDQPVAQEQRPEDQTQFRHPFVPQGVDPIKAAKLRTLEDHKQAATRLKEACQQPDDDKLHAAWTSFRQVVGEPERRILDAHRMGDRGKLMEALDLIYPPGELVPNLTPVSQRVEDATAGQSVAGRPIGEAHVGNPGAALPGTRTDASVTGFGAGKPSPTPGFNPDTAPNPPSTLANAPGAQRVAGSAPALAEPGGTSQNPAGRDASESGGDAPAKRL